MSRKEIEDHYIQFFTDFLRLLLTSKVQSIHTGKDGGFTVPPDTWYLYANRKRENGESCHWLLNIGNAKEPPVRLSNSNIASKREADEWMFDVAPAQPPC